MKSKIKISKNPDGLILIRVKNRFCRALVSLQGAQILEFKAKKCKPLLWMSSKSFFTPGKPIRGGIPICWPYFGAAPANLAVKGEAPPPAHGYARINDWRLTGHRELANGATQLDFEFSWQKLQAKYRVIFGKTLQLELKTKNLGKRAATYSEALHTYFPVGDIKKIAVRGLENAPYCDRTTNVDSIQHGDVRVDREIDRIYENSTLLTIEDPVRKNRIKIKSNGRSAIVWNPWVDKSRQMADFGNGEYKKMICVESGNVATRSRRLAPGKSAKIKVKLSSDSRKNPQNHKKIQNFHQKIAKSH